MTWGERLVASVACILIGLGLLWWLTAAFGDDRP
jgi:hypothetical protein